MLREDTDLSGSCTIVLYFDEAYYIRLLRRGSPRVYLTRAAEIPTGELERLKKVMDMCRDSRVAAPIDFIFGDNIVRVDRDKVVAAVKGQERGEGWTESCNLSGAIVRLFHDAEGKIV